MSITSCIQFPFLTNSEQYSIDFSTRLSELLSKLDEYGFCIIKNVFNATDILEAKANIGDDILELFDLNNIMNDSNITNEYDKYKNMSKDKIIDEWKISQNNFIDRHCLPQGRFSWQIRLSSKIRSIFETIYGNNDLVGGMDSVFYKAGGTEEHNPVANWCHADQNTKRDDCESWDCYQSVIAIFDLNQNTSETTVVWPKSHKNVYQTLIEAASPEYSHYIELSLLSDPQFSDVMKGRYLNFKYIKEGRRVPLNAGDMVVWNSKCLHQGYNNNGRRLAMPVCYEPRCRRSSKAFITKVKLAVLGVASTHWASIASRHSKYLQYIQNHMAGSRYSYINTDGNEINFPIKDYLVPFIIKDEYRDRYHEALNLARQLESGDTNEGIMVQLQPMLKEEILNSYL